MNWWLVSCAVSGIIALILAFVLGAFWLADRADELANYADRQLAEGDNSPWEIKGEKL
jgi:hypothetical protein